MSVRRVFAIAVIVAALAGTRAAAPAKGKSSDAYPSLERFISVLVKVTDHYTEPVTTRELVDFAILGMVRGLDPDLRRFTQADIEKFLDRRPEGDDQAKDKDPPDDTYRHIERFVRALVTIQKTDTGRPTYDTLTDLAIRGMLSGVDPSSSYLNQNDSQRLNADRSGPQSGIGITVGVRDTSVEVISLMPGSPAGRAGIRAGDRIAAIGKVPTHRLSPDDVLAKLRGEKGTPVDLRIYREGRLAPLDCTVLRGEAPIQSVPYASVLSNGVGYIQLVRFDRTSREELNAALTALERQNVKGLILDLRSNTGGLFSAVAEVAETFTPSGTKMFYTRGRDASQNRDFVSSANGLHVTSPLVVLVDQSTSSGAEIVAGCVQDLDLGAVLGGTTAGSVVVQTVIPLAKDVDGPKLKLTTAKVYMPSGRCIHKEMRGESGALGGGSIAGVAAAPDSTRPREALREFHTAMGRIVHGGEGIVPDLEMPAVHAPEVIEDMDARQIFHRYAVKCVGANRDAPAGYALSQKVRDEFTAFLDAENFKYQPESLAVSRHWVDARMRRELALQYGNDAEAYRIGIEDDEEVRTAAALVAEAPTLPQLFALIAERNKAKAGTPLGAVNR